MSASVCPVNCRLHSKFGFHEACRYCLASHAPVARLARDAAVSMTREEVDQPYREGSGQRAGARDPLPNRSPTPSGSTRAT